jgi:ferrous iron transport protein A
MQTLDQLQRGAQAAILNVGGHDAVAMRLMEMGLYEGEPVEIVGRAPFRDPITVLVRGSRLALRTADARRITVGPLQNLEAPSAQAS